MKKNCAVRVLFFAVMLAMLLSLAVSVSAEVVDPCSGGHHKGPYRFVVIKETTCTEQGEREKWCEACGQKIGNEPILPIGHQMFDTTTVITKPTCLTEGLQQKVYSCRVCSYIEKTTDETIPALGHDWGGWVVTKAATCTEKGVETRVCKRDASHVETRTINELGHDWGDWVRTKNPTCEGYGEDTRTCKNDPSHKEPRSIAPIGHKWDGGKVTRQPNCTDPGERTYTCQNDPSHTKTEPIGIVSDAHIWDGGTITKAPNCSYTGEITYTCTLNSAHKKYATIPVDSNAHDWDSGKITKQPTCDEPGTKVVTCRINAAHTKIETIPALGHKWDKGVVIKQPTLTEEGIKQYTCQNDPSHTKTETLGRLTMSNNTVCAFGPRLRETYLAPYNTDRWYMFTPFDASKEGVQTYELVASNMYIVGNVTLTIRDGYLTVNYQLSDPKNFNITLEFFTVLNKINDIIKYEPEDLLQIRMTKNQPINLAETFGDDTNLVLYFCSRCTYTYSSRYTGLNYNSAAHQRLLTSMKALMD